MNRRFSQSPSYYALRLFLGAVKAMMLIKQETLMNWRRYRKALLPTGERPGIRVVRRTHRVSTVLRLRAPGCFTPFPADKIYFGAMLEGLESHR